MNTTPANTTEDIERIRLAFEPLIKAWEHTCNTLGKVKSCIVVTVETGIGLGREVYGMTLWTKDTITTVYDNGLWNTTSQVTMRFGDHLGESIGAVVASIKEGFFKAYDNGLWNTVCDTVSWIKTQLDKLFNLVVQGVFYVREIMALIAGMMDWVMSILLSVKYSIANFVVSQKKGILDGIEKIDNLVSFYSKREPVDAFKCMIVDSFNALSNMLTLFVRNTKTFATLYKTITSQSLSYLKTHFDFYIPETYTNELIQSFNSIITWISDVILVIRLVTTWVCHNVVMVILKLLEMIDPTNDVTFASSYGREMFWKASRMGLLESAVKTMHSLVKCFIYSKMVKAIVNGAIIYRDAMLSKDNVAYNILAVMTYACIYTCCRMRFKIGALCQSLLNR